VAATAIVDDLEPARSLAGTARFVGLLYLVAVVLGPFSLIVVPSVIVVSGNAAATADNIRSHEMLLRLGIFGDVITGTVFLFVVLALYQLLKGVDRNLASVMVILGGIIPLPIFCINAMNWIAALLIAHGTGYWLAFSQEQRDALAMLFMQLHRQGNVVNSIFWGLWLLPFGTLVIKSQFLPRILGIWLLIDGVSYLATSSVGLLIPQDLDLVNAITQPALFGELAIMVWLIVMGARERRRPRVVG
jgi:hypothetical protein